MGKAVKAIGIGVAIIGLAVLTGGISLAPTMTGSLAAGTAAIGTALTTTTLGGLALSLGAGMILTGFSTMMRSTPKIPLGHLDRLNASLNPSAPRTIVFGETALGTDIRYIYPSGTDQRNIDYIIGCACHKLESVDEVWSEDRKGWASAGGYQSWTVVGGVNRLSITTRLEGSAANAINVGGAWVGSARLTGCGYVRLWIDRQGSRKTDSPFVSGLPSRLTIRGKGMPLYDPRLDSTNGGSGAHRPGDQTTWGTATGRDNPALQILAYLLGWRIGGKLSVGRGVPPERLDLASFIVAANVCDESVALSGGGTQPRYRTAGIFNEADDTNTVLGTLLTSCAGEMRETGGKLGIYILTNDLASPVAYFDDNNILGPFEWSGEADLTETPNVVRGRYTDPSDNALYNLVDFPEHSIPSLDGMERVLTLDLPAVQDGRRAQRIAKQALQRAQYTGTFSAEFDIEAWKCTIGDVVALSFEAQGWSNKLFRVVQMAIRQDGRVPMVLREENAAIYAWSADESAVVTAAAPTTFDPLNAGAILAAAEAAETANWSGVVDDGGKPEDGATRDEPGNLLPPSSAQFEAAGWVVSNTGSVATAPVAAGSGWAEPPQARGLLFDLSASTSFEDAVSLPVPVVAGGRVHVQFLYATKGTALGALRCLLYYRDVDGAFVDSSDFDVPQVGGGTYALYGFSDPVPEGAATVELDIYKPAVTSSGEYRFGKIFVTNTALAADVTSENNAGGLIAGSRILQNGAPSIQAGASPFEISVVDGDVITFSPQLAVTPKASFELTGLPALSSGETYSARAETLTGTGCTVRVKKRTSGGSVSTISTGTGSVITTDLEYQVSKGDSRDARDHNYKMRLKGKVRGTYSPAGGGWFDYPLMIGGMTIEIFAMVSAAWQSCGVFTITPPYGVSALHDFDETFTFACANAIGDPAGNEFRALVTGRVFTSDDKLTELTSVTWQVDGSTPTETAVTQAVTMRVQPQNV